MMTSAVVWWIIKMYSMRESSASVHVLTCGCGPRCARWLDGRITGVGINFVLSAATAISVMPNEESYVKYTGYTAVGHREQLVSVDGVHYIADLGMLSLVYVWTVFIINLFGFLFLLCIRSKQCLLRILSVQVGFVTAFGIFKSLIPTLTSSFENPFEAFSFELGASISMSVPEWTVPGSPVSMLLAGVVGPCLFGIEQIELILDDKFPVLGWSLRGYGKKLRIKFGIDDDWDDPEPEPEMESVTATAVPVAASAASAQEITDEQPIKRV